MKGKNKSELFCDLIANLIIGIGCGMIFRFIAVFSYVKHISVNLSLLKTIFIFACGFIIGSSYGMWHAYIGWKRNDSQIIDDNEFGIH